MSLVTFSYSYKEKNYSKSFNLTVNSALPLFEVDTTFGVSGEITVPRPFLNTFLNFEFDGSGNIFFSTSTYNLADTKIDRAFLSRYSVSSGGLDLTFNGSGSRELDMGGSYDWAGQILVEDDGKFTEVLISEDAAAEWKINLIRFNADGTPDASFGTIGRAHV